jgi:NADPH:quinone reductase-like Zn-dependent oxidoreductase
MPERMHAVVQKAFGGPEVLEVAEVDRPVPLGTEVLVRVEAVGVNPVEPLIRSGRFPLIGRPPFILGWDISGVIEGLEGVTRFEVGDEVYGMPFFPRAASAYAQYVAAPSRQLARKPPGLSHAEAAALPLAGLTAWQSLVDTARLAAGQRVLIHGAGGGVGHLAVQIAKARGAYLGLRQPHQPAPLELADAKRPHGSSACGIPASAASAINGSAVMLRIPAASFLPHSRNGGLAC